MDDISDELVLRLHNERWMRLTGEDLPPPSDGRTALEVARTWYEAEQARKAHLAYLRGFDTR